MPHKHKRRKQDNTASLYDLPPTQKAKALPARKDQRKPAPDNKSSKPRPVSSAYKGDDTPKAFKRLISFSKMGKGIPKGIDDGNSTAKSRKRKREDTEVKAPVIQDALKTEKPEETLKIQPGERLSDFAIRVNQTLPIAGLSTKGKKVEGAKERRTKHEKRLRKLQEGWRKDEARIREKEEEERENAEEEWEEKLAGLDKEAREVLTTVAKINGKAKKGKKSKAIGEVEEDEEDPWAVLNQRREAPKGVFDVARAPPRFEKVPREVLKAGSTDGVPRGAGSLRRRERLGDTRAEIISRYRELMAEKRKTM